MAAAPLYLCQKEQPITAESRSLFSSTRRNIMLAQFITLNREEIVKRCRAKVAARAMPPPTEAEIDHGVPLFLDQLVNTLRSGGTTFAIDLTAGQHGHDLRRQGFTVSQVVHDYGDVCQTVTRLAEEKNAPISTQDFRALNRCLDDAIASAVTIYTSESQRAERDMAESVAAGEQKRLQFLIHEIRNLVGTAVTAFEVLRSGSVGTGGSTAAVLGRTLTGLRDLTARSLEEVRLTNAGKNRKRIFVSELINEIGVAATLEARARDLTLVLAPGLDSLAVDADRQILAAVVGNLLQNAFKFTRPGTTVTLSVGTGSGRVLIQVHDECGGLPGEGEAEGLVASFEQHGVDRSGLGIGLTFCRWGAEVNGGRLYASNRPGQGCVFTVDLPRAPMPVPALAQAPATRAAWSSPTGVASR